MIVSEWPPGAIVSRLRFLTRNRVIAALATATLVVEAASAAGRWPPPDTPCPSPDWWRRCPARLPRTLSRGPNSLIRERQAILATSGGEVIDTALSIAPATEAQTP